jgi:excinuclease ABC subunit C
VDRDALSEKVALFPTGPGVYTFLDDAQTVIYVGKAVNLRSRVRSYLRAGHDGRRFYAYLVDALEDVRCFTTHTEKEALLLEHTLITRHKPRWNIKLTDDKSYLQVEVTTHAAWPKARLIRARSRGKKGTVFGPYSSARAVRETLRHLKRWFPLRTCSDAELRQRTRPCIEFEMNRCIAPCVQRCTTEEYDQVVQEVLLFLKGKNETLIPRLKARMAEHSEALRYEQAARLRDQIRAIERTLEGQRVTREVAHDQDVFGVASAAGVVAVLIVRVREGQVTEPRSYELRTTLEPEEALNAFLGQVYGEGRYVPREIVLPFDVEDRELLSEVLSERKGVAIRITAKVRGDRAGLLGLARKNAVLLLATGEEKHRVTEELLAGLREAFGLTRLPRSIECFDISTIQGAFTVASKVRFEDGVPAPSGYRTYKIRTVEGQDDFASMQEVVERRLRSGLEKGDLPDLIVVDGGPMQLARALDAAKALRLPPQRTEFVGLAKARATEDETSVRGFERVFLPRGGPPVIFEPASLECRLMVRIRDAAHNTAIRYHRELRRKSALRSGLEEVPGLGPKRRSRLLSRFGSLKGIRAASPEELREILPDGVARALQEYLANP